MKLPKDICNKWYFSRGWLQWGFYIFWTKYYEDGKVLVPFYLSISIGSIPTSCSNGFFFLLGYPQILPTDKDRIKGLHIEITELQIRGLITKFKSKLLSFFV